MTGPSLLIVEDDPIVATDLSESLQQFGYHIIGVERSGEKAVERARSTRPDLVLMDITLEGKMDGISAAQHIQAEFHIPIIYLTAHSDEATLRRARVTQPYAYVLKPFEEVELRIAIDLALYRKAQEASAANPAAAGAQLTHSIATATPGRDIERLCSKIEVIQPFSRFPRPALLELLKRSSQLRILQGEELDLKQEAISACGFTVLIGRMSVLKGPASKKELIVELLLPGDTYGLFAQGTGEEASFRCRAQADSHLVLISRDAFLDTLSAYPHLYRNILDDLTRRLRDAHNFARALAHDRVEVRIVSAMLRLGRRFSAPGATRLQVPLTRQELADLTGTTVETAIRVTRSMEKAAMLDLSQTGMIELLDIEKLESMLSD